MPASGASTSRPDAPQSSRIQAISSATSRKFTGTAMAPSRFSASTDSMYSGQLVMTTPQRSPAPMPRAASAAASRSTRSFSCDHVVVRPEKRSAVASGFCEACRSSWVSQV